ARETQRTHELTRLAEQLGVSLAQVYRPSFPPIEPSAPQPGAVAPLVADRLPGRAAFLEAVAAEVERAYAVGPSAVAFTLPGLGRADGLAALARIESRAPSSGRAVEWKPEETPV